MSSNNPRRVGALVVAASLAIGGAFAAPAANAQSLGSLGSLDVFGSLGKKNDDPGTGGTQFTLLDFNDFHGRISAASPSTVAFADTVEKLRKEHGADSTALISSGDNVGASLFASSFEQDQPTIDVLNALDLKTSAVGNHEFDKGVADLQGRIDEKADWDYLGANVTIDGEQMQPYEILDINGVKVGVVGAVTQETSTLVSPAGIEGVTFGDPVAAVNKYADELKDGNPDNGEADVVVASYHEGAASGADDKAADKGVGAADNGVFGKIAHETSNNVSAIFTAHTHMTYDWRIAGPNGALRPVMQTGSYGANLGSMTFDLDPKTKKVTDVETALTPVPNTADGADLANPVVAEVKTIVDGTLERAKTEGEKPVGTVTADITTAYTGTARDDRASESTLGNLVGDYMVDAVKDRGGAEIAFMNPGGLRADLLNDPAGEQNNINKADANGVLPFANTIVTMNLTGAQVKKVLEQQWQPAGSSRPFLALGTNKDLTWTFDPTRPEGDRITSVSFKGEPIGESTTYKVVSQSFLAAGGDNFVEFNNATDKKDTGLIDSDTWMAYLGEQSPVSPNYAKHAVAAKGLPSQVAAGGNATFTLADVNLTSLGSKTATTATVEFDGAAAGTATVSQAVDTTTFPGVAFAPLDGSAVVEATIPAGATPGAHVLTVTLDNGTVVTVPVTVA